MQVGRHGRTVSEVADDLGCDWHTVMDAVVPTAPPLIDDPDRIGRPTGGRVGRDPVRPRRPVPPSALVDPDRRCRRRPAARRRAWSRRGRAVPLVRRPPRGVAGQDRLGDVGSVGPYRAVFDTMLPDAIQVADPFHVVRVANKALDECRRRVQNDTIGHRGRQDDPLYRARRLLTMAAERLPDQRRERLVGLLAAGDPKGEVKLTWHANYPALGGGVNDRSVTLFVRGVGGAARGWRSPGCGGRSRRSSLVARRRRGGLGCRRVAR